MAPSSHGTYCELGVGVSYGQVKQAVFVLAGTGSLAAVQKDALIKLYYLALRNISKK